MTWSYSMSDPVRPENYAARAKQARQIAARVRDPVIAESNRRIAESYEELAKLHPRTDTKSPGA